MRILQRFGLFIGALWFCFAQAYGAENSKADPANDPYEVSYRAGETDPAGHRLYGIYLMKLVPLKGRLYAITGDDCAEALDPHIRIQNANRAEIVEPQVLVLNASKARWRLEQSFGRNSDGTPRFKRVTNALAVKFETDGQGKKLEQAAEMLVAGLAPFGGGGNAAIYTGIEDQGRLQWAETECNECRRDTGRAFGFYRDPLTGVDRIFVGVQMAERGRGAIISGVYDPKAPGRIRWGPPEEHGPARVMAFAVLDNRLFALRRTQLLERESQMRPGGPAAIWKVVYTYSGPTRLPLPSADSGLRGLTVVPGRAHTMLAVMEGSPGDVLQFTLTETGIEVKHEAPIADLFRDLPAQGNDFGGRGKATYFIAGFNDIPTIRDPHTGRVFSLIGLEQYNHIPGHQESAWFVARGSAGYHTLHEVRQLPLRRGIDEPLHPNPGLRAVRSIVVSPFEEDHGQKVLFMGGFDPVWSCDVTGGRGENNWHLHDDAWIYRVGIDTALEQQKRK
jgi:hypothetical protein